MKRDLDLVREILLFLEENDSPCKGTHYIQIPEKTHTEIAYHIRLMIGAGFVTAKDSSTNDEQSYVIIMLTNKGHDYIDKIRSDTIWNKAKKKAGELFASLPYSEVAALCLAIIREKIVI